MTTPAPQNYRTHALLTENPEDERRMHHVFWVYRPSYDQDKAAQGLGDIEKHEIDSCLILRGAAQDVTQEEAMTLLSVFEKQETARGGTIEQGAEAAPDNTWPRSKLGRDFMQAKHYSQHADDMRQAADARAKQASILDGDINLPRSPTIKSRVKPK